MFTGQLILVFSFVITFALTAYLASGAKSHVQPARFFIAALLMIVIGYGFSLANNSRNASVVEMENAARSLDEKIENLENAVRAKSKDVVPDDRQRIHDWRRQSNQLMESAEKIRSATAHLDHIATLLQLVAGAFAGALASAAITNRAKAQHDASVHAAMNQHFRALSDSAKLISDDIQAHVATSNVDMGVHAEIMRKAAKLAVLVRELELLSAELGRRELENIVVTGGSD